jgi:uncharacterized protein YjbJ (UPF0337 family)
MGAGLPTDEALQAHAHVEQRAQAYRAAGIKRPIDILRVAAYLDLLNLVPAADRVARFEAEDAAEAAGKAREATGKARENAGKARENAGKASEASGKARENDRDGREAAADDRTGDPEDLAAGDAPGSTSGDDNANGGPGSGSARDAEPAVAAEVNLTLRHLDIPLFTAAGTFTANDAQRPGEARSLGPLDPGIARRLAEAAARHPDSKFCVTITDSDGHAIGHGCCTPRRRRKPRNRARGQRDGPPPPSPAAPAFTLTPGDGPGPPGGYGSWVLTLPGQAGELTVDLHPVPTGECGHQYESARHDPGDLLRHLVHVRDGKCGFPACSRHARETDFEHGAP